MSTELGVGYLSIVADTSRIPGQITSALGGAQSSANSAGESMGSRLASGIGKTLKVGMVTAGVAAGGLLASSLHKGIGRLSAIDDAQGKLTALGNSTAATAKIMDSALASVKGTSYGLGDAATIAASAVAAGVKPGQDLTRYLSLTADAASIAGVSLSEMGQIINKVQTSGTAYTMEITQLADRGLPIWQWLATEMKKPQAEMKKLVAEGKVDSATYLRAIENNIGGAATAATTVSSAWANLGAAQGRFGATIAGPIFRQAIPAFLGLTKAVDELDAKAKPVMATFEKNLTGKYIPAILDFGNQGKAAFEKFRDSDFAVQSMSRLGNVFDSLMETGREIAPALGTIVTSLSKASAALGVSTWQIFLSTLDASAQILNSTLVPVLNVTAGLMENNQGAVVGLAAAFLAFKTIPALISRVSGAITPVGSTARTATGHVTGFASAVRNVVTATGGVASAGRHGSVAMGSFGSSIAALGQHAPVIARMQTSFLTAATDASRFGRTAGTVSAAMTGMKAGVSGLAGALGGPLNIALMAATAGFLNYQSGIAKANNQQRILADSAANAVTAQGDLMKAMTGGSSQNDITAQVVQNVKSLRQEQQSLADKGPSMMQKSIAGWDGMLSVIGITRGETEKATIAQRDNADASKGVTATLDKLKLSNETVAVAVSGSALAYNKLRGEMLASGDEGKDAAKWLAQQRDEYQRVEAAMRRIGPAGIEIASAIDTLSDSASTSTERLSSMKQLLIGLGLIQQSASEALFGFHEELDKVTESAEGAYLAANGLGDEMLDAAGKLDPTNKNAQQLHETLSGLRDNMWAAAEKGNDANELFAAMGGTFDDLAKQTGFSADELRRMFLEMAGSPDAINIGVNLKGADEARQVITELTLRFDELANGKPIDMVVRDEKARNTLRELGLEVEEVKGGIEGEVSIRANNEVALAAVKIVFDQVGELDAKTATPNIDANTATFRLEDEGVRDRLAELRREEADPKIGALLDEFIAGRDITLRDLQTIDLKKAKPEVILAMQQALADARFFSGELDEAARKRTAVLEIRTTHTDYWESRGYSPGEAARISGPVPVRGGYAGMRVPGYEGGGKLPTTGPGTDTVDGILAVDSWGIPTARVNRGEWVINDRSSERYHRELASINAGTFPKLPGYETGGVVGSRDLTDFVMGRIPGVKPLTGDPYNFGGINWGDCCLIGGTRVAGPDGAKQIKDLAPGDRVYSYVNGRRTVQVVNASWFSKKQRVFKVRTRNRSVVGSDNHPFLRLVRVAEARKKLGERGSWPARYDVEWARLDELAPGDLLVQPKSVEFGDDRSVVNELPSGREVTPDIAWLIGLWIGNGTTQATRVEICSYGEIGTRAGEVFAEMGATSVAHRPKNGVRAYGTALASEFIEAGLKGYSRTKTVPEFVWNWSEKLIRSFLDGFLDADGSVIDESNGRHSFSSSSHELASGIRALHIMLGDRVSNLSTHVRKRPISIRGVAVKNAAPLYTCEVKRDGGSYIGPAKRGALSKGVYEWIESGDFTVARILDITPQGEEDTYDIEVDGAHNFIADGVVVHNSAAMSAIARFAVGLAPFADRFATGNMGAALSAMGFLMGRGGAGDLRFGWYNGGPGGGHTAGTLPDGTNVEMGGSYGGGMVGGSVGSNHLSFTDHAHLPIKASPARGGAVRVTWTDKEQLDLEAAEIAVRKAEEARVEVENAMAEGKKTQTDLDDANNKVAKAQEKVTSLQAKKDGIVDGSYKAPPPQAPALSRMFTDSEIERIDAQLAVQSANERRNEVYDNPESTDADISKADAELYKAEKALRELGIQKAGDGPTTWSGIAGDFAKNAVSGLVSDALGVFGIPDELPPAIQAMQMFEKAQQTQAPYLIEPSADQRAMGAQVTTSPSMIAQDSPAIYNPAEGIARWGDSVAQGQDGVAALLEEIERIRTGNRFAKGGPVGGPGGTDNVPAWLTKREFVVNALDANAGENPAILQAMNNGARLSLGQGGQSGSTYIFNGVANVEEGLRQLRVKEKQEAATHGWGIR